MTLPAVLSTPGNTRPSHVIKSILKASILEYREPTISLTITIRASDGGEIETFKADLIRTPARWSYTPDHPAVQYFVPCNGTAPHVRAVRCARSRLRRIERGELRVIPVKCMKGGLWWPGVAQLCTERW
jgi:hypothetical protein